MRENRAQQERESAQLLSERELPSNARESQQFQKSPERRPQAPPVQIDTGMSFSSKDRVDKMLSESQISKTSQVSRKSNKSHPKIVFNKLDEDINNHSIQGASTNKTLDSDRRAPNKHQKSQSSSDFRKIEPQPLKQSRDKVFQQPINRQP